MKPDPFTRTIQESLGRLRGDRPPPAPDIDIRELQREFDGGKHR